MEQTPQAHRHSISTQNATGRPVCTDLKGFAQVCAGLYGSARSVLDNVQLSQAMGVADTQISAQV